MTTLFARLLPRCTLAGPAANDLLADVDEDTSLPATEEDEIRLMVELSGMVSFDPAIALES